MLAHNLSGDDNAFGVVYWQVTISKMRGIGREEEF
jgi:hypothetical protein